MLGFAIGRFLTDLTIIHWCPHMFPADASSSACLFGLPVGLPVPFIDCLLAPRCVDVLSLLRFGCSLPCLVFWLAVLVCVFARSLDILPIAGPLQQVEQQ